MKHKKTNNKNPQKGFTILVAVVTAGILLIIAMSIGGIALKEQVLSTANKESQVAFYAADTGMECALYWDQIKGAFAKDTDGGPATSLEDLECNGLSIEASDSVAESGYTYSYTFMVDELPDVSGGTTACSIVTVAKDTTSDPNKTKTRIKSHGYNTCNASLNRLERGIETTYPKI